MSHNERAKNIDMAHNERAKNNNYIWTTLGITSHQNSKNSNTG